MIRKPANQPFVEEYLSIKLCRLFVHDGFPNPTTRTELPECAFYDYTNPNRSAEAELVHQCMLAWENSNPKGQIRAVLSTLFNSDLFRSHGGSMQKVKTPLEYVASSVRALRSVNADGSATASTDAATHLPAATGKRCPTSAWRQAQLRLPSPTPTRRRSGFTGSRRIEHRSG